MKKFLSVLLSITMALSLFTVSYAENAKKGDVNSDRLVNSADSLAILKNVVQLDETEIPLEIGDMNNDLAVDSADALIILKICVGEYKLSFNKDEFVVYLETPFTITNEDYKLDLDFDKIVLWESSDSEVAEIDENGVITGHKIGATVITATTEYGSKASVDIIVTVPVSFDCLSELPVQVGDGTTLIEIQNAEVIFSKIDDTKIKAELKISGVKISDNNGDENSDNTFFNLLIYKNGEKVDSNQLKTEKIKTGDAFTVTFTCSLTAGNEYSFDFVSTTA